MPAIKQLLYVVFIAANLLFACTSASGQVTNPPTQIDPDWEKDQAPFRIAGNLYYVGTYDLACYLITTPKGHILINTGIGTSASMIHEHIKRLGFKLSDVKILLATHAHFDHVGAMAEIKKETGARLLINEQDAPVMADGGNSDYNFGGNGSLFEPVKADGLLHEHDTVSLGGTRIVALHTPGHTKGACSFLLTVKDEHKTYRVLIATMPKVLDETNLAGMPGYPDVGVDYGYSFYTMRHLQFDIWVASHTSQFSMHEKHMDGSSYNPDVFNDRKGYDAQLDKYEKEYLAKIGGEKR